jgi:hypothetical protein
VSFDLDGKCDGGFLRGLQDPDLNTKSVFNRYRVVSLPALPLVLFKKKKKILSMIEELQQQQTAKKSFNIFYIFSSNALAPQYYDSNRSNFSTKYF